MSDYATIIHDPGHGGRHTGTVHGGIIEKTWTLEISKDCHVYLGQFGIRQDYTRTRDVDVSLEDRGRIARDKGASLVISHHANAIFHPDVYPAEHEFAGKPHPLAGRPIPDIDGLIAFYLQGDWMGREVAAAFMRGAPAELKRAKAKPVPAVPGNWTRRAWNVLRHHQGTPAVLVEWGFTTAPRDVAVLTAVASRPALVAAAGVAVGRFLELRHAA